MEHPRFIARFVAASAVLLGAVACSSSGGDEEPAGPGGKTQSFCSSDANTAPEFSIGMNEMGTNETFRVTLEAAEPAAPVQGTNDWTVKVTDAEGNAVEDATITIKCSMPGHTHGCAVKPTVTNLGGGLYQVDPVIFNMPRNWNVAFTVTSSDGEEADTAILGVCIG